MSQRLTDEELAGLEVDLVEVTALHGLKNFVIIFHHGDTLSVRSYGCDIPNSVLADQIGEVVGIATERAKAKILGAATSAALREAGVRPEEN